MAVILSFVFLDLCFLSLWIRRDPRIWGSLLVLSFLSGLVGGTILYIGVLITLGWAALWISYKNNQNLRPLVAVLLVVLSFGFKFHLFPGFIPVLMTPKFLIGMDSHLVGLFPLALLVPLAVTKKDWKGVLRGFAFGCIGIAILAGLAIAGGVVHWQYKLPTYAPLRYGMNVITCMAEEGFYRGFIQAGLCHILVKQKAGKATALLVTSLLFTAAHLYWAPTVAVFGFTFLAGLLYGGVYLISEKIESAILTHFLLNFIHMTFFSYHAM